MREDKEWYGYWQSSEYYWNRQGWTFNATASFGGPTQTRGKGEIEQGDNLTNSQITDHNYGLTLDPIGPNYTFTDNSMYELVVGQDENTGNTNFESTQWHSVRVYVKQADPASNMIKTRLYVKQPTKSRPSGYAIHARTENTLIHSLFFSQVVSFC